MSLCIPSSERAVGDGERMMDLLQRWGQHRAEVRFFLRHNRAPSRDSGKCPSPPCTLITHNRQMRLRGVRESQQGLCLDKTFDTNVVKSRDAWSACCVCLAIHNTPGFKALLK